MNKQIAALGIAGLFATAAGNLQAQPYYVSGSAMTPAWAPGTAANELTGSPLTLTTATLVNAYHEFKVTGATWGDPNYPGSNVKINGDANGSNTFYFYPGTIGDGWFPLADRVGYANPGNAWELSGDFTSPNWGDDATALMTVDGNGVFSINYVLPTTGTHNFKFKTVGTWDGAVGLDFGSGAGNISFVTVSANQSVGFQFDPAKGRYLISIPPVTNYVVFAVDMSSQIQLGKFAPGYGVYVAGAFNNWPSPGGGLVLTNDPPYNGGSNTNIYYGTNKFIGLPGSSPTEFKFNNNAPMADNSGWEQSNNRSLTLLTTNGTLLLPVVNFNNTISSDYFAANTMVTFTVNMTNAMAGVAPSNSFDPDTMLVRITGNFDDNGWAPSPWSPPNLRLMTRIGGSSTYTYTHTVLAGHPVDIHYKYSFDDGVNPLDNEAPAYQDHIRVVRTPASGSYTLPMDTFGNQHVEPAFGGLTIAPAVGGKVSVQWLGRPGVKMQNNTSLNGGAWTTHDGTDGATWTGTTTSTSDGTATVTNLPASGSAGFIRLVKPN
jgi:hypothetical protein